MMMRPLPLPTPKIARNSDIFTSPIITLNDNIILSPTTTLDDDITYIGNQRKKWFDLKKGFDLPLTRALLASDSLTERPLAEI